MEYRNFKSGKNKFSLYRDLGAPFGMRRILLQVALAVAV